MSVNERLGIQPAVREELTKRNTDILDILDLRDKALSGDMVIDISPSTLTTAPTAAAWTRTVTITIQTATGDVHTWLTRNFANTVSIDDTSALGTASITSTTLSVVNGVAIVEITGDAADWLNGETDTLTIANITILGYTVTGGTSVEKFTA